MTTPERAWLYDSAFKRSVRNGSVETINDLGGENVRWRGEITRGRREIP